MRREDRQSVDELLNCLFDCWKATDGDFTQLLELPGVSQELLETVEFRVANAKSERARKRQFRALFSPVLNSG
jgi:hypothetical protein